MLVAMAYLACAYLSRLMASYDIVTAVWPPTGLALATLALGGRRLWPGVALGELLTVTVDLPRVPLPIVLTPLATFAMVAGNSAEALVGATMIRRFGHPQACLDGPRAVMAILLAPLVGGPISATAGTLGLLSMGALTAATLPDAWWTWWVGNALGSVVVTPFLCAWCAPRIPPTEPRRVAELGLLVILGGLTAAYAMFGAFPSMPSATREGYLMLPFLVWSALRFGLRGAATAVFVVSTLALLSSTRRAAAGGDAFVADIVLRVQVFVGSVSATILLLAGAVAELRRVTRALIDVNRSLEASVLERTRALAHANHLLFERNEQLSRANAELDGFAGRVAHDLRAPVRAVRGFTRLLQDGYAEVLGPDGLALLARVSRAATQMGALIEGLLDIARLGSRPLNAVEVDVAALLRRVAADLDVARSVELRIGPVPPCVADPALLESVFTNLIQNAVKYSRGVEPAWVEVGGAAVGEGVSYYVRDNGVGFDMAEAGRLFRPFSRLHGSSFEGTGLGLATVMRIVQIHGGRVWAEGVVGGGATFSFQLPAPARQPVPEPPREGPSSAPPSA